MLVSNCECLQVLMKSDTVDMTYPLQITENSAAMKSLPRTAYYNTYEDFTSLLYKVLLPDTVRPKSPCD